MKETTFIILDNRPYAKQMELLTLMANAQSAHIKDGILYIQYPDVCHAIYVAHRPDLGPETYVAYA